MSKRVLLCDDEVQITRAAEIKFRKRGYEVECAGDGQEAWDAVVRHRPDLLITDFQMPVCDGGQLCQRLRTSADFAELPIFMLTGKGYELTPEEVAERWGVLALVTKPFSPRELVQMVDCYFASGQVPKQSMLV